MQYITLCDPTLRDGNHAIHHQLTEEQIALYASAADAAGVPVIEVGHGNGLGASSIQVGRGFLSDEIMLTTAKKHLKQAKLSIHVIPGFATIKKDLQKALDLGVDIVRVASHCTEADLTKRHIEYTRNRGKTAYGVLMMSHMATPKELVEQAKKMESYGAEALIIMDSAGAYLPKDLIERIKALKHNLSIDIGFHAHNNLGLAIGNSLAALEAGATILDGTSKGFGAGAGNAQLEILVAILKKLGYDTKIDLFKMLDAADIANRILVEKTPFPDPINIVSGLAGVFSGFVKHVQNAAQRFHVDPRKLFLALGERKVIAGQEDLIIEIARGMK